MTKCIVMVLVVILNGILVPIDVAADEKLIHQEECYDSMDYVVGEVLDMDEIDRFFEGTHYMGEIYEDETEKVSTLSLAGTWIESNGRWWYRHTDGTYTSNGWENIDGYWYYFDASGWMLVGWQPYENNWYYLRTEREGTHPMGSMATGWITVDGKQYYLYENVNCYGEAGLNPTAKYGQMLTGWVKTGGYWYYCDVNTGEWIDPANDKGVALITEATQHFSTPYDWGGDSWITGVDCSGFTMLVTQKVLGITLPHHSASQYTPQTEVPLANRKPGDLVFFLNESGTIGHVAFHMGTIAGKDGYVIQASNPSRGINISYRNDVYKACRRW